MLSFFEVFEIYDFDFFYANLIKQKKQYISNLKSFLCDLCASVPQCLIFRRLCGLVFLFLEN